MMTLKCTKEEVINLIEQYYQQKEGRKVTARISAKKECMGLYETEGCVTTIKVKEEMEFLGMRKEVETLITKKELQDIFNALLEEKGYIATNLTYDDGLHSTWEGCYMNERIVKKAYFDGITLEISNKKEKTLSRVHKLN